jgi:hypothetical protein
MNVLLIDGIKYKPWKPKEEKQLEESVREHYSQIFGENSLYFDIKPELRSKSGIGSKPDGIVIIFDKPAFYVVENERAEHGVHDHIVTQISKFNSAFKKPETRQKIVDTLYFAITNDPFKQIFVRSKVKDELYKFLSDLINSRPPTVVIIIDELLDELEDAVDELPLESKIVQFQTFVREDADAVRAYLFEPLYVIKEHEITTITKPVIEMGKYETKIEGVKAGDILEIEQRSTNERKYRLFRLTANTRRFFPGYKIEFILETDIGNITSRVVSAMHDTQTGNPYAGTYISGGLRQWYDKHPEVIVGTKLRFECIEPLKRYKLTVVK